MTTTFLGDVDGGEADAPRVKGRGVRGETRPQALYKTIVPSIARGSRREMLESVFLMISEMSGSNFITE